MKDQIDTKNFLKQDLGDTHPVVQALLKKAADRPRKVLLPEFYDARVQGAALYLKAHGLCADVFTIPTPENLLALSAIRTKDPEAAPYLPLLTPELSTETERKARELALPEELFAAADALNRGYVDLVVAGAVHTTGAVVRTVIKGVGLKQKTLSSFFLMLPSDERKVLMFSDCAVVVSPTDEQRVEIAESSLRSWMALFEEVTPKIAFLSFSTKGSASHASLESVKNSAEMFAKKHPKVLSDGELQFDAAYARSIAERKCPHSPLEGDANIYIFPDLNSGNIAYKIAEQLGRFQALGPLLQGSLKPFSDLSRGCSTKDIIISCCLTSSLTDH